MSGNSAIQGSTAKNARKISASTVDPVAQRYGRVRGLSTARSCQGFHHFDRLFALPRPHDWASVPPPKTAPSLKIGFSMSTSFPETKTGLRLGLASAAVTGCIAVLLLAGLPLRAEDANPVLAKVNGSGVRPSDSALAEGDLGHVHGV